jgi:hypothetical protein
VCTGREPLLQLDGAAIEALHARGFRVVARVTVRRDSCGQSCSYNGR